MTILEAFGLFGIIGVAFVCAMIVMLKRSEGGE